MIKREYKKEAHKEPHALCFNFDLETNVTNSWLTIHSIWYWISQQKYEKIGLIIHFSIALFSVYTEFGIDSHKSRIYQ